MSDPAYKQEFDRFLEVMQEADCLNNVFIIGSWAEYLYEQCGVLKGFETTMQTIDMDILIENLNRPVVPVNLVAIAKENGYIYQEDYINHYSRLIGKDNFEIEFLITQRGDGSKPLPRTNIGVNAEQLSHTQMLKDYSMIVVYKGLPIRIPEPEAYVLHKMIINSDRNRKKEKDQKKISSLLPYIDKQKADAIYKWLFKKEKKAVDLYLKEFYNISSWEVFISKSTKENIDLLYQEFQKKSKTISSLKIKKENDHIGFYIDGCEGTFRYYPAIQSLKYIKNNISIAVSELPPKERIFGHDAAWINTIEKLTNQVLLNQRNKIKTSTINTTLQKKESVIAKINENKEKIIKQSKTKERGKVKSQHER